MKPLFLLISVILSVSCTFAQNSMVGDGFGGRSWYKPHNYQAGAYSAYTVCDSNNQLYGWGGNNYRELGTTSISSSSTPFAIPGMSHVKFYTTGYISAVIKEDNTAWCWGTGYPTAGFGATPVQVMSDVRFADAGTSHVVFVKNDGTVWAAGYNDDGQLGNGTRTPTTTWSSTPVKMVGITNAVRAVAIGISTYTECSTLILLADGTVKLTGGYNWMTASQIDTPTTVTGLTNIVDIKGNNEVAYALNANGEVFSIGRERSSTSILAGALGLGSSINFTYTPTKITFPAGTAPIIALSSNNDGYSALALDENKNLYAWGSNTFGQIGAGSVSTQYTPALITTNVVDIFAGETFSYILKADSTMWATGGYVPYGSIWMNLSNTQRNIYTQINPTIPPMNLCAPKIMGVDSTHSPASVGFTAPDTVCVNTPVNITNTSTGATSYYWNFCVASQSAIPTGSNLGNFGFNSSVFMDYALDGGNYYGFVTNNFPGNLVRLNFGNSLLNTPVATSMGTFGGVIPDYCEGIQLVKDGSNWYAIIVGGNPTGRIVRLAFGNSLANTPVATDWGNVGNLSYPVDLHVFQDGNNWYGFTINAQTSTITRFNFGNSFSNTPTGVNLGNVGGLNFPTGIFAINNNNQWHVFVTNQGSGSSGSSNSSLTRLDFGTSLLNTPTGVNLGNPGNSLRSARDITIYKACNEITGYAVNYSSNNDIVKLNFNNNLTATPTAVSIGNIGTLDFPHCISKFFRVNNDLYAFIVNVANNSLSRLKFTGCSSSSIPSSTASTPPAVTYNTPGTYNINLTTDEGLATQQSYCKQIVVIAPPVSPTVTLTQPTCSSPTGTITITAPVGAGLTYSIDGTNYSNTSGVFTGLATGSYNVTVRNKYCTSPVTAVNINTPSGGPAAPTITPTQPTCSVPTGTITITAPLGSGLSYSINGVDYSNTTGIFSGVLPGTYNVTVKNSSGCKSPITTVVIDTAPATPPAPTLSITQPSCTLPTGTITVTAPIGATLTYSIDGINYSNLSGIFPGVISGSYNVTVKTGGGCISPATQATINAAPPMPSAPTVNTTQPTCTVPTGTITISSVTGLNYSIDGTNYSGTVVFNNVLPNTYNVTAQNSNGCISPATVVVINPSPGTPPTPTVSITQPTCTVSTATVTITAPVAAGLSYSIDGVDYTNTSGTFTGVTSGPYNITVKNSSGCISSATAININPPPPVPAAPTVNATQPGCTVPTGTITITSVGGLTYSIDGTNYSGTTVFSVVPNTYNLTAQNSSGCISPATVVVINPAPPTPPAPTVTITQPTCTVSTGTITITSPIGTGLGYSIDGVDYSNTSGVFSGLTQANYNVTVQNSSGCISPAAVAAVSIAPPVPPAPTLDITQPTCTTPTGTITITAPIAATSTYSIDGTNYVFNNVFNSVTPGTYNVTVNNGSCNSAPTVATINNVPVLILTLTANPNPIAAGSTVTLTVTGSSPFSVTSWQPTAMFPNQTATSQTFTATSSASYKVTGKTADECEDTATLYLKVNPSTDIFIPNTFTPNDDGYNDVFYVYGDGIQDLELIIWNQWGEKIFETKERTLGWNGMSKGKMQPVGVYVYVARITMGNGDKLTRKGSVNLIR